MNSVSLNEGQLSHAVQFFFNNNEDDEMSYTVVNHHSFNFFDSQVIEFGNNQKASYLEK
jgi:hypothetical protein